MASEFNTTSVNGSSRKPDFSSTPVKKDVKETAQQVNELLQAQQAPRTAGIAETTDSEPVIDLQEVVQELQQFSQNTQRELDFQIEEGDTIITVRDAATQEVIREIPPKEVRDLAQKLQDGLLELFNDRT